MEFDDIFKYILSNPKNYPGKHQESQPRINNNLKPLEPIAQFHIILNCLCDYIEENLLNAKSINIKKFGCFTFNIITNQKQPKVNYEYFQKNHNIKPCFILDGQFASKLTRYLNKKENNFYNNSFNKGFQMIYCNPTPISIKSGLSKSICQSALESIFSAVLDLTYWERDLNLNFKFCNVMIDNKNFKYIYNNNFVSRIQDIDFENKMKKSNKKTSSIWKEKTNNFDVTYKPTLKIDENQHEKTLTLRIMSLDMNSTNKVHFSK